MRPVVTLTCPHCGHHQDARKPDYVCVYFHGCRSCGARLRAKPDVGCVLRSYGGEPHPRLEAAE